MDGASFGAGLMLGGTVMLVACFASWGAVSWWPARRSWRVLEVERHDRDWIGVVVRKGERRGVYRGCLGTRDGADFFRWMFADDGMYVPDQLARNLDSATNRKQHPQIRAARQLAERAAAVGDGALSEVEQRARGDLSVP